MTVYRRLRYVAIASWAALSVGALVIAYTPILRAPVRHWVRSDPLPSHPVDAIVVLGGYASADRVLEGVALLKQRRAPVLVTASQGSSGRDRNGYDTARLLEMADVGSSWRRLDSASTTQEEAMRIQDAASRFGWRSILVVTSPMHTRRACATIEHLAGITVTCIAAFERAPVTRAPTDAPNRIEAARQYSYELLATWKYRWRGWM